MTLTRRAGGLAIVLLALAGCSSMQRHQPVAETSVDDDAYCQANGGVPGSAAYVACRKDRDVQRSNATSRADRAQRNLADYMISHPEGGR